MSKRLMFVFATLVLVTGCLHAQSASLMADIPFNFRVGDTVLPAGTYTIKPMGVGGYTLEVQSTDSKNTVFIVPVTYAADGTHHDSELVFQLSGQRYSLWQIWTEDYYEGRELFTEPAGTKEANVAEVVIKATTIAIQP